MRKKSFYMFIIMILTTAMPFTSLGAEGKNKTLPEVQLIEEQIEAGGVNSIGSSISRYAGESASQLFPEFDPASIMKDISTGKFKFSLKGVLEAILDFIFHEIYINMKLLIRLIILAILCAVLKNLQTSFLSESVGELAFYACYIVMVAIMILSFSSVVNMAVNIIDNMVAFMQSTIPVLLSLLVSGGNITTAAIFQPVLISVVGISATIIKALFIPLIFLSTVLHIVDNISDKVQISKLAGLLKQISGWALGILMTVFIAVVSVQGSLGAVVDGVTSKTTKFAIGAFIPVAGKYLSDAADTVIGCTLLIKNAGGVLAMIGIIMICLVPLLKMFALIAVYRLTSVLVEPISQQRITNCINDMAGSLTFILGIVASVAVMFLISLAVIISAGNISAMIR